MVSMMNMTLKQMEGMWLTKDANSSMLIGVMDPKRIEISVNRKTVVSECTQFEYDAVQNNCRISESVILKQLFEDGDILIRVQKDDLLFDLILSRRK